MRIAARAQGSPPNADRQHASPIADAVGQRELRARDALALLSRKSTNDFGPKRQRKVGRKWLGATSNDGSDGRTKDKNQMLQRPVADTHFEQETAEPKRTTKRHLDRLHLTPREMSVLQLIVKACTNKEIARRLSLRPTTVAYYLTGVYKKIFKALESPAPRSGKRVRIVRLALKYGLVLDADDDFQ